MGSVKALGGACLRNGLLQRTGNAAAAVEDARLVEMDMGIDQPRRDEAAVRLHVRGIDGARRYRNDPSSCRGDVDQFALAAGDATDPCEGAARRPWLKGCDRDVRRCCRSARVRTPHRHWRPDGESSTTSAAGFPHTTHARRQ